MADASNAQTSFLGGEFSPYAQGVFDDPDYKKGMNVCRNVWPIETGAATRRAGTRTLGFTRKGQAAKLFPFRFTAAVPATMEFTDSTLRFYDSEKLVLAEEPRIVRYISQGCPALLVTSPACDSVTWAAGNTVVFNFVSTGASTASGYLVGRQFTLKAGADDQHWTLFDAITGKPLDGSKVQWTNDLAIQVGRVLELSTPYDLGSWAGLRMVQNQDNALLLSSNTRPQLLFAPIDGGALYTLNSSQFKDGPYLDPPTDGSYLITSGVSGVVVLQLFYPAWSSSVTYPNGTNYSAATQTRSGAGNFSMGYSAGSVVIGGDGLSYVSIQDGNINHAPPNATWWKVIPTGNVIGGTGFQDTDVGRLMRLLAQPATYDATHAYAAGDLTTYQGAYYTALVANTGKIPGTDATNWGVASNAAKWTWGIITEVFSGTQVALSIQGDPLLYNANITTWRIGAYSDTTGWPTVGCFHEGRWWLGGAIPNRFDASGAAGDTFNFAPTGPDGTVSDANAVSYTLLSKEQNQLLWMTPALGGILAGTAECEWVIQSTVNNDPITPTNIQAHTNTAFGSANVEAVRTGPTVAFVQRYGNMVMEYLADLFSGKPAGKNLSARAKHLTGAGIVRVAYQEELVPILWALTADNKLIGTTYKRESMMVSQPPNFNAWHRHDLGSGFNVVDMVVSGSDSGLFETATIVSQDPATGVCRVEVVTDLFNETSAITDAWFVDDGIIPCGGEFATVNGVQGITMSGFGNLEGKTVDAFICGLDCGTYTVTAGQIFVPYQADPDKLFTAALIQQLGVQNTIWRDPFKIKFTNAVTAETIMQFPPLSSTILNRFTYLNYGAQAIADWKNDRVTFLLPGTGPLCGFVQYKISTGQLIQYVPIATTFGSPNPAYYDNTVAYAATQGVVGSDGNIYLTKVNGSFGVDPTSASGSTDWVLNTNPAALPSAYAGGTTYAVSNYVTSGGIIYKSLQNANTGHTPASSPTWWQVWMIVPPNWSASTIYGSQVTVTGSDDHIYWAISAVPAGAGDPTTFTNNNNPYWRTSGGGYTAGRITASGISLDFNGDLFMYQSGTDIGTTYVKIDGNSLTLSGIVTTSTGLTVPSPSNYSVPIRILNNHAALAEDFLLSTVDTTPSGSTAPSAYLINTGGLNLSPNSVFTFDEGNSPIPCASTPGVGAARAYVLTRPVAGNATALPVGLYEITVSSPNVNDTMVRSTHDFIWANPNRRVEQLYDLVGADHVLRKAGTVLPVNVDPLWTFFTGFTGLMFDPGDGNLITYVGSQNPAAWNSGTTYAVGNTVINYALGSDNNVYKNISAGNINHNPVGDGGVHWTLIRAAAVTTSYIVKLSADCAKVIWAVPVANAPSNDIGFQTINIQNGYFDFLESLGAGAWQVRRIFTLTGKSSIIFAAQAGLAQLGGVQVFNGATGDIIIYPQYDSTASGTSPPPTRVDPAGGPATPVSFTNWARWNVTPPHQDYIVPGCVGFSFTSQGQLLRPVAPAESGARNGPAFGKTRRNHRYALACANTQGMKVGSDFTKPMRTAAFKTLNGLGAAALPAATLYTGEHSDTVEGDYNLDGMLAWQVTRPYPATVTALGGFLQTQDR